MRIATVLFSLFIKIMFSSRSTVLLRKIKKLGPPVFFGSDNANVGDLHFQFSKLRWARCYTFYRYT